MDKRSNLLEIKAQGDGQHTLKAIGTSIERDAWGFERIAATAGKGARRVRRDWTRAELERDGEAVDFGGMSGRVGTDRSLHREAVRRLALEMNWPPLDFWVQGGGLGKYKYVFTCLPVSFGTDGGWRSDGGWAFRSAMGAR